MPSHNLKLKTLIVFASIFLGFFCLTKVSHAVEPICPEGSNPDPNVIWCDDFEDSTWTDTWSVSPVNPQNGVIGGNYGYNSNYALSSSDSNGNLHFDGSWGYEFHFGESGLGQELTELSIRFYIRFTDPFVWGGINTKGVYFRSIGPPPNYQWDANLSNIKFEYNRGDGKPGIASYALLGEYKGQNQGNDLTWELGKWYYVEFHVKLNDPGVSNGIAEFWIDEASPSLTINNQTLRLKYTNLLIRPSGNNFGYTYVFVTCYNNMAGNHGTTQHQEIRWDQIVVSKIRIGPVSTPDTTPPSPPSGVTVQ
jgi:hypothetical protein